MRLIRSSTPFDPLESRITGLEKFEPASKEKTRVSPVQTDQGWDFVADLFLGVSLLPTLAFLFTYILTAKGWSKDRIGWMFVLSQTGTALVSIIVVLSLTLGLSYPGREFVRSVGYILFCLGQSTLLYTYLIERRKPHSKLPTNSLSSPQDRDTATLP